LKANRKKRIAEGKLLPLTKPKRLSSSNDGYQVGFAPEHPMAYRNGVVLEHRRVGYEKYGPGSQTCNWCGTELEWSTVEIDHLDWNRANNHPDNLVTSCKTCNLQRKSPKEEKAAEKANEQAAKLKSLITRLNR
jgi:hypothetical protein